MDSNLENINNFNESWCRTCNERTSVSFLHSLEERTLNCPSLADMLLEIAKINIKMEDECDLPKHVCGNCMYKLKNAYAYVMQAQQVNKQFLAKLGTVVQKQHVKQVDCLLEAPIDMDSVKIKTENIDESEGYDAFKGIGSDNETKEKDNSKNLCSIEVENLFNDENDMKEEVISTTGQSETAIVDPITIAATHWESDSNDSYDPKKDEASDSSDKPIFRPVRKRRRTAKNASESKEGRFPCNICGETFAWKNSVLRHERSHFAQPQYECSYCDRKFFRKDKLNDHTKKHLKPNQSRKPRHPEWNFAGRLYSDKPFQVIQCKICENKFDNTYLLRQHLIEHTKPETLQHLSLESEIVKEFFNQIQDLDEIRSAISKDITQQQLAKYVVVINEFGYELCLSDSDTDMKYEKMQNYKCELCNEIFTRKHKVFGHIKEKHSTDQLPYRCVVCKLKFVCEQMYKLHTKSQCRCKEKKYKCAKCPGKFMWLENLKEHKCSGRKEEELTCNLCDETFTKSNDLTNHMATHDTDETAFHCTICEHNFAKADELRQHFAETHAHLGLKIRCCLCEKNFTRLSALRTHLQQHADGLTDVNISEGYFFKIHYPQGFQGRESEVAGNIAADFMAKRLSLYYITLDESYNELDLDDTETENEDYDNRQNQSNIIYECYLCRQTFYRRKHILSHQITEHAINDLPYTCTQCNKKFVCESLLQYHLNRDCHNKYKKFECTECGSRFVWELNLKLHLQARHATVKQQTNMHIAKNLQCDLCYKVFIWPRDLTRHKREQHVRNEEKSFIAKPVKVKGIDEYLCTPNGTKIVRCMICQFKHTKINELLMHLRSHQFSICFTNQQSIEYISTLLYAEEPPMQQDKLMARIMADIAMQKFERFYSITNEVGYELNLTSSDTECEEYKSEPGTPNYQSKTISNKIYNCDLCDTAFQRKYKLFEHQLLKHEWSEAPYACSSCDARFLSANILQTHLDKQCQNTQKRYLCFKCPLRFMWKDNLIMHLRTIHLELDAKIEAKINFGNIKRAATAVPDKKYLCELCGFAAAKPSNLVIHMRRHTGEKPFKCDFCDKAFPNSSDLKTHRQSHTGEKPYICMVCNKAFPRAYKLRIHMRTHSGERPYICTYCNKSFTHSKNLTLHVRRHTGERPFVCGICGQGFIQGAQLRKHRQMVGHHEDVEPKRKTLLLE